MFDIILPMILGVFMIVIGILNMNGDVRSLHKYHRHRVAPEDIKAYGKLVGIGTLTCGGGLVAFGIFELIAELLSAAFLTLVGSALLIVSVVIGLIIMFFAMFKYNKGIF